MGAYARPVIPVRGTSHGPGKRAVNRQNMANELKVLIELSEIVEDKEQVKQCETREQQGVAVLAVIVVLIAAVDRTWTLEESELGRYSSPISSFQISGCSAM